MKILFEQGTPGPLRHALVVHDIISAFRRGWHELRNGELLAAAEADGFDLIITTDKNWRYQQNLAGRRLAILVLWTTDWRFIRGHAPVVAAGVEATVAGGYVELPVPTP